MIVDVDLFLVNKSDTLQVFTKLTKQIQNQKFSTIGSLRSDHGDEFYNHNFTSYCVENGISHNFFAPRTPQ